MSVRIPVDVIVNAMYIADETVSYYFDAQTGEIVSVGDPFECDEADEETQNLVESDPERFILLPGTDDVPEDRVFQQFAREMEPADPDGPLRRSASHLHARTLFPEAVDAAGKRAEWEAFRERALAREAAAWARCNGYEAVSTESVDNT